ncbi:hypothetical protein [Virgibacillus dokdonensis]|uniref:Peptidase S8/S53 domain-containing protein n=1 Tax=Virgibacillus dokdonensis TaxID=302167 RepID=A0A2K9J760_9BACI|nr:hypothetical protein [Virgibacillus dokdonensis]AUJ25210.1 hypothetical protein A21D_02146 [Virgibacillus dokdonensis]
MSDGNKNNRDHFWIPDTEVEFVKHEPTARPKKLDIDHFQHGNQLSLQFNQIKDKHKKKKTPISDELMIFKVSLSEDEQIDSRGSHETMFNSNKLKINAILKSNEAIVSTSTKEFDNLNSKLQKYIKAKGESQDFFQHFKSFSTIENSDIQTEQLVKNKKLEKNVDVQITLLPKLDKNIYNKMVEYLLNSIEELNGVIGEDGIYSLSDNTPVIRVILPSSGIDKLTDQEIILKAEPSPFFDVSENNKGSLMDISTLPVTEEFDIDSLPLVCILDNGVNLPSNIDDCIADRWIADGITSYSAEHGTKVASRAIFGDDLDKQVKDQKLIPKTRVIDAIIHDGIEPLYEGTLIKRIKSAINDIKLATTTFCLSFNAKNSIGDLSVGNLAYEIDCLCREGVNFVIPTGNHSLWSVYDELEMILDDSSSRLSAPGESFYNGPINLDTK